MQLKQDKGEEKKFDCKIILQLIEVVSALVIQSGENAHRGRKRKINRLNNKTKKEKEKEKVI